MEEMLFYISPDVFGTVELFSGELSKLELMFFMLFLETFLETCLFSFCCCFFAVLH